MEIFIHNRVAVDGNYVETRRRYAGTVLSKYKGIKEKFKTFNARASRVPNTSQGKKPKYVSKNE